MSRTVRGTLIVAAFACSLGLIAAACSNHGSQTSAADRRMSQQPPRPALGLSRTTGPRTKMRHLFPCAFAIRLLSTLHLGRAPSPLGIRPRGQSLTTRPADFD